MLRPDVPQRSNFGLNLPDLGSSLDVEGLLKQCRKFGIKHYLGSKWSWPLLRLEGLKREVIGIKCSISKV